MARILAGRYELEEKIGEGGMAVVFRSRDILLGRSVAVKILRPEYTTDQSFIESFRKESQLAASIVDPNIVNVYDVGKEGNVYYIVMELVEGEPLSDIIKREGPLEPRRAANITRQIAMALSTAHKHNLIHRDVKPHNVLISAGDIAKISDFGIAIKSAPQSAVSKEKKESVMGSIHYFSPEQARGAYVDERSDIYSLGIVLYEMLTGKVPFDGENAVDVALKHMNEQMVPPSRLNPNIPQDLEDIVMKATSKLQTGRYSSADELITDLNFVKYSRPSDYSIAVARGETMPQKQAVSEEQESQEERRARLLAEHEEEKKAKRKKFIIRLIEVLVISALIITGINFISKLGSGSSSKTFNAPNIVGMTVEEATEFLKSYKLNIVEDMQLPSDKPEGTILSQNPQEGKIIKAGQTIKVNVSKGGSGTSQVGIPSVVGKTEAEAKSMLENAGYKLGTVTKQNSASVQKGNVISQEPAAGTSLSKGSPVNVVISSGSGDSGNQKKTVSVPRVIQFGREEAIKAIEEAGLVVGEIEEIEDPATTEDFVISQDPAPGEEVEEESEVKLKLSVAPPEARETTLEMPLDYSKATQDEFKVMVVLKDGDANPVTVLEGNRKKTDDTETVKITGKSTSALVTVYFIYTDEDGKETQEKQKEDRINFQTGDVVPVN